MENRIGEKIGWIGGWAGGFIWVFILSIVYLAKSRMVEGISGIFIVCLAVGFILEYAPWKHPTVAYWKLMLPIYGTFFLTIAWSLWVFGGMANLGLSWWAISLLCPILFPLESMGRKRWQDGMGKQVVNE